MPPPSFANTILHKLGCKKSESATAEPPAKHSNRPKTPGPVPHEFVWKYGGNKVILTGSFDNWSRSCVMTRDPGDRTIHRATLHLDPNETHQFKFVVDGVWRCSLDFGCLTDEQGNVNNVLRPEQGTWR